MRNYDHETLLAWAKEAQAAASGGDTAGLEAAATRLMKELEMHLDEEAGALVALAPGRARVIQEGQDHLRTTVGHLVDTVGSGPAASWACSSRADELVLELSAQAQKEEGAWKGTVDWDVAGNSAN